ncbi:FtsX-like permease family protein [Pelotomaculum propionicicum]|uniref:FtsX-like permease family protein n=1 Tax=Pelotomaculum propionicicum TaxID=258475 RepID=UPI003B7F5C36
MSILSKKLWRTVKTTRGQFLAVTAVVMLGITIYISMSTVSYNMLRSRDTFYREYNFADYYFHVIKAPEGVIRQIESVPGVTQATGRIQKDVPVIGNNGERATARLTSYPLPMNTELNSLRVLSGRLFEKYPAGSEAEVLLDPQYAAATRLSPGDTVKIVAEGRQVPLTVVGTATAPEFIYPMKDAASIIPEYGSFGIFMVPHNQAQEILNLSGQVNQVVIKIAPGADEKVLADRVESILEPYGSLASYPRRQQLSDAVLGGEMDQLKIMARFLPSIFLGIAALIEFVMLGRMVKTQRSQIGTMKAIGYNNPQILWHYTSYAVLVGLLGAALGSLAGVLLASSLSKVYAMFFNLPEVISGVSFQALLYGFILSIAVGAIAGLTASRGVLAIQPAESMRAETPKATGNIFMESWSWFWHRLSATWKMGLRTVFRNRFRTAVTMLGVTFATGMMVVSFFYQDTVDVMIDEYFSQKYDYFVRFTEPVKETELLSISRLEGVTKAEPVFEIPVKIYYEGRSQEELLTGLRPGPGMQALSSPDGNPLALPDEGVLISSSTAKKLQVGVGDEVEVETLLPIGPTRFSKIKIMGVHERFIGGTSYLSLQQANRVMQEDQLISGAMLKTDAGLAQLVKTNLNDMTGVSSILSQQAVMESFTEQLGFMYYFIFIMVAFALVLGFAIVYNASVISFAERKRELASLRVIGFTFQEVSGLLLKENLLQTLLGVAFGLPFGRYLAGAYINAMMTSSDVYSTYSFKIVIYPLTYTLSAFGGILFIMAAYRLAVRGVKTLDLVEVLKTRD